MGPISSARVTAIGLPVFSDSIPINSSLLASIASAILFIAFCRSPGVDSFQISKAHAAAFIALSTSAALDTGAFENTSPVAGLIKSWTLSEVALTFLPLTKFCSVFNFTPWH
jgi:hypothetical protein